MMRLERVGETIGPVVHEYRTRDVALYHLGIGAGADDLDLVYEGVRGGLKVCPTFAVIPSFPAIIAALSRFEVPPGSILHGEEAIFLEKPIPPRGKLSTTARVPAVYDKGKAALLIVETESADEAGEPLFRTRASVFCRGLGGFGGDPGPRVDARPVPAGRAPDFEVAGPTAESQAALYRLSGDLNPLHIDPAVASAAGFPRPILHGLCTFGFAGRAVVRGACGNDVGRLREFGCRFSAPVFPGETVTTRGWRMGGGLYLLQVSTGRGDVLSQAYACVREE
ncbi:MAG: MaoC/PaaZ C-terminal domain-containing protein [Candidatus Deferrimicrobiota bacterium]